MLKDKKLVTFVLSSLLIFGCSVEKPITKSTPTTEKTTSKAYESIKLGYPDFKDSNLELPDTLILQRESYLEIIDKKGNTQKKIPIGEIYHLNLIKEKNLLIFTENYQKIRIINYETGKEQIFPVNENNFKFGNTTSELLKERNLIIFNENNEKVIIINYETGEEETRLLNKNILHNNTTSYYYEGEIYFLFVKIEDQKTTLCTSDLKGNIKELSEIDIYREKSYSLSKNNKKVSFVSNGDIYTINIDGSNKFKLVEKSKDNTGITFSNLKFSPNNEYLAYTKFNSYGNPNETYVIKSDTFTKESKYTSENFVAYGDSLEWLDNESFSFKRLLNQFNADYKNVIVKIKNLSNKLMFTELDNNNENNIVVPEDYTLFSKSKSYDNKKIAYNLLFQYAATCSSQPYSINKFKTIGYFDFGPDGCYHHASSSYLYISDSDGKNAIKLLQVGAFDTDPIKSLDTFVWSSDSKFLFVAINNGLYIYDVEKNQIYTNGKYDKEISQIIY